jgi:hypothetical protein
MCTLKVVYAQLLQVIANRNPLPTAEAAPGTLVAKQNKIRGPVPISRVDSRIDNKITVTRQQTADSRGAWRLGGVGSKDGSYIY